MGSLIMIVKSEIQRCNIDSQDNIPEDTTTLVVTVALAEAEVDGMALDTPIS